MGFNSAFKGLIHVYE